MGMLMTHDHLSVLVECMAFGRTAIELGRKGSREKLAQNNKRPGLSRVWDARTALPKELLTFKVRAGPEPVNATFVLMGLAAKQPQRSFRSF
jgi:hypothetical protein